jgi:hypothetical protein
VVDRPDPQSVVQQMIKRDETDFAVAEQAQRDHNDFGPLVDYLTQARPLTASNKMTIANVIRKLVAAAKVPGMGEQP